MHCHSEIIKGSHLKRYEAPEYGANLVILQSLKGKRKKKRGWGVKRETNVEESKYIEELDIDFIVMLRRVPERGICNEGN